MALLETALESVRREAMESEGSKCTLSTGMLGWTGREGEKGKKEGCEDGD